MMNKHGKSDRSVVSTKLPNKGIGQNEPIQETRYTGTKAETPDTDKQGSGGWDTWGQMLAEAMEKRDLAKGNPNQQNTRRMQCRERVQSALERIRQAAVRDSKVKFTALMHHIYSLDTLELAYFDLKRDAAPGVDGQTWREA